MTYSLLAYSNSVRRDADNAMIPNDPANIDWVAYQAWVAAGNTPTAAPTAAETEQTPSCQLWQLQAVLTVAQWSAVQSAVTALNSPAISAFFAHGTNVIPATSTTLLSIGATIGLTASQVAALVVQAAAISIP